MKPETRDKRIEFFKLLTNNSFDIISVLSIDGIIAFESNATKRILGYESGKRNGSNVFDFVHPDDREHIFIEFNELIMDTDGVKTVEFRYLHDKGDWIWLEAKGQNLLSNKEINGIIVNSRDITQRKKAENALKESEAKYKELNATKDKFFSIISHDLKNPLNTIIGFLELALNKLKTKEYKKVYEYCALINQIAQQSFNLLDNLLNWSRLQTGTLSFTPELINFSDIVKDSMSLLRPVSNEKNIEVSVNVAKQLKILADSFMIETIIRNLLSNALKFTRKNGRIKISAIEQNDEILIEIEDTGVGIREKDIDKLFRIENNFSTTGTQNEKGTGLGLILCKEFIEKHGGRIWVESEINKGTKFMFTINNAL